MNKIRFKRSSPQNGVMKTLLEHSQTTKSIIIARVVNDLANNQV